MHWFKRLKAAIAALSVVAFLAPPVLAKETQSQVIFTRKNWEVRVVAFPDASLACVARVDQPGSSFSIWADGFGAVQLQFYSTAWSFDNETADIVVQVDRRAKWDLTNAELNENSILFNLPDGKASERFLVEIAKGNKVKLFNTSGRLVEDWSLAGSLASIQALVDCADQLKAEGGGGADKNPFN